MNVARGRKISESLLSRSAHHRRQEERSSTPPPRPGSVTIPFDGPDSRLFHSLQMIARKERRTIEQQILYLLDQCSLETFVAK